MSGPSKSTNMIRVSEKNLKWDSLTADQRRNGLNPNGAKLPSRILSASDPLPPSNRLIVIIPDSDFNIFEMTKQIWDMANPDGREVLLITKPIRHENNYHSRLILISLANLIRDSRVTVQKHLIPDEEPLVQAALQISQPEDIIVCFEEHRIPGFLKKKRLAEDLAKNTSLPIITLKGSISEMQDPVTDRFIDILLLIISLVSIVGFFGLQIWFDHNTSGSFHTILQILSTFVEIWFIAVCSSRSLKL